MLSASFSRMHYLLLMVTNQLVPKPITDMPIIAQCSIKLPFHLLELLGKVAAVFIIQPNLFGSSLLMNYRRRYYSPPPSPQRW